MKHYITAFTIAVVMFTAGVAGSLSEPLPLNALREFTEVFGQIKANYVLPVDDKTLLQHAIRGMVTGLDPHSDYLDKQEFKELSEGTRGEFGGLGLEVGAKDGYIEVITPIDDTPAAKADVRTGDLIIAIDGMNLKGVSLNDAVKKMRGKPGTDIELTIARKGANKPLVIKITRAVIEVQSVKSRLLDTGYGYIRLSQFQEHSGEKIAEAVKGIYAQSNNDVKGIVLDLRNDPGGLLNVAVGVAGAFLPKNTLVVYTDGRTEDSKMRLYASPEYYMRGRGKDYLADLPAAIKTVPIVVLVNGGSASASEIVAAALQDNKRAIIMGEQTFGKASVQTIIPLGDGSSALKLTTARYYTPNGRLMQNKGVTPDVEVVQATITPIDKGVTLREEALVQHLTNPDDDSAAVTPAKTPSPAETAKADYQLNQALNLLKGLAVLRK
jgi:carboxyl-terminal processing protease